jgi:hypothetical protein
MRHGKEIIQTERPGDTTRLLAGVLRGIIVGKMGETEQKGASPDLPSPFLLVKDSNPRSQDDKDSA